MSAAGHSQLAKVKAEPSGKPRRDVRRPSLARPPPPPPLPPPPQEAHSQGARARRRNSFTCSAQQLCACACAAASGESLDAIPEDGTAPLEGAPASSDAPRRKNWRSLRSMVSNAPAPAAAAAASADAATIDDETSKGFVEPVGACRRGAVSMEPLGARKRGRKGLHASPVAMVEAQLWSIFSQNEYSTVIDMFRLFDADASGIIDIVEFRDVMEVMGIDAPKKVLDATFASFDADGSGGLDYREFYEVLQKNHTDAAAAAAKAAIANADATNAVVTRKLAKRGKGKAKAHVPRLLSQPNACPVRVIDMDTTPRLIVDAVQRELVLEERSPSWRQYVSDVRVFKMMKAKDRSLPMSEAARSPRHLEAYARRLPSPVKPKSGPSKSPAKKRASDAAKVALGVPVDEAVAAAPRTISQILQQTVTDAHRAIVGMWSCILDSDLEIQIILLYLIISAVASAWSTGSRAYAMQHREEGPGPAPPAPPVTPSWDVGLQNAVFSYALANPMAYLVVDFGLSTLIGIIVLFWRDIKMWWKARELAQRQREMAAQGYATVGDKFREVGAANSVLKKFKGLQRRNSKPSNVVKPKASPRTRARELTDPDDVDPTMQRPLDTEADLRRELAREGDLIEELELKSKVHTASTSSKFKETVAIRLNLHRERRTYLKQALTAIVGDEEDSLGKEAAEEEAVAVAPPPIQSGVGQWLLDSGVITVLSNSATGFISCYLFFIDVYSDAEVIRLLVKTGNLAWAMMAAFFLVAQYVVVYFRVLPYMRNTFGADSCIYYSFLYLGFPLGVLVLDILMLLEPFGLLAVLPLPLWIKEFVPAYKATRVITEIAIESLPQALLQSYILVVMTNKLAAGTDDPHIIAMVDEADDLPTSITISTLATLKTWIDIVQQSRGAGISVRTKAAQLWHVGAGLPLDALIKGSITDWRCGHELSPAEIPPLIDALVKNTSLRRLNLATAGLEWQAADGSAAPLVEAMQANDGLSALALLVISKASGFENPVGKLRSGHNSALAALEKVTFFAPGQGRGPWAADILMCGDVLRSNRNRSTVTDRERDVGEVVAKLLLESHNGEIDRELWEQRTKKLMADGDLRRSHLQALISAECLRDVGFRAADLVATGISLRELKAGHFTVNEMREGGVAVSDLSAATYTASELHEGGVSAAELKPLGYEPSVMREGGFSASEVRAAKYDLADLKGVYTASELCAAEYPAAEMQKAGFEVAELREAGWRVDLLRRGGYSATEIREGGFDAKLAHEAGYSAMEAASAGWPLDELKAANYDATGLRKAKYSAAAMREAGYMAKELKKAGYAPQEMHAAGFNPEEIRQSGVSIADIMAAGATLEEMHSSGVVAAILKVENVRLKDMRLGGYTCKDVKAAGYKAKELKAAGFVEGLKAGGYPIEEAVAAKYKVDELFVGGYSAEELIGAGFKPLEMRAAGYDAIALQSAGVTLPKLRAAGVSATDLRNAGFSCDELREVGVEAKELQGAGASAAELKASGYPLVDFCKLFPVVALRDIKYTCEELRQVGFKAGDVLTAGASALELREGGFSAGEMKKVGISAMVLKKLLFNCVELKEAGFTAKELAAVGFGSYELAKGGYRPRLVKECGFKALSGFDVEAFKADGFQVPELREEEGFTLQQLASCFSVKELRVQGGVSAHELLDVGYSLVEICQGGFNASELFQAGYSSHAMKKAGYTCSEVRQAGFVEGIKEAGYTCTEARAAGYHADLKRAGFTPTDLRKAGCTFEEAKAAGFVKGLKEAGYSCSEAKKARFAPKLLRAAGYTCIDARAAGYTKELKLAGYTPTEARAAGSSCEEAKEAGYVHGLCEAGYTVKECFDANFECAHVRMAGFIEGVAAAGFTIKEAKVAGYSSEGLRLAGFSCMEVAQTCTEAKAAGYTAAQCHAAGWSWKAIADAGYSIRSAKPKGDMTPNATELQDLSC